MDHHNDFSCRYYNGLVVEGTRIESSTESFPIVVMGYGFKRKREEKSTDPSFSVQIILYLLELVK